MEPLDIPFVPVLPLSFHSLNRFPTAPECDLDSRLHSGSCRAPTEGFLDHYVQLCKTCVKLPQRICAKLATCWIPFKPTFELGLFSVTIHPSYPTSRSRPL